MMRTTIRRAISAAVAAAGVLALTAASALAAPANVVVGKTNCSNTPPA